MTVIIIILGVMVLLAEILLFLIFPSCRKHNSIKLLDGKYIAHRGLHSLDGETPENSLKAFKEAMNLGLPIEIDIHLTADGEVVVFHDDTLDRMCGVSGKIEEKTLPELKTCRLKGTECEIPTLKECLDLVNGKVPLLIEFKCISIKCDDLCVAADKVLCNYKGGYLIQSFYPTVLRWYKKHRKNVCRGQLAASFKGEVLYKRLLGCLLFNVIARPDFVSYKYQNAKSPFRRLVTKLGAYPIGWTFTSNEELHKNVKYFNAYIFEEFLPEDIK